MWGGGDLPSPGVLPAVRRVLLPLCFSGFVCLSREGPVHAVHAFHAFHALQGIHGARKTFRHLVGWLAAAVLFVECLRAGG